MKYCICCERNVDISVIKHSLFHDCTTYWIEYRIDITKPLNDVKNLIFIYCRGRYDNDHNSRYYDSLYVEDLSVFKGLKTWGEKQKKRFIS